MWHTRGYILAEEYFEEVEAPTKGLALIKDAGLWVPVIGSKSCDLRVLMDQPTKAISSHDLPGGARTTGTPGSSGGACPNARCGRWPL